MIHTRVPAAVAATAGLLPIFVVHAAYFMNVAAGDAAYCNPYWDGCLSVSRGVRSGPGLDLFKILAAPTALLMAATWWVLPRSWPPMRPPPRALRWLGTLGAAFFLVYAMTLGTDGELYRWMRRYGVVFYFGLTGLAQLLLAGRLLRARHAPGPRREGYDRARSAYLAVLGLTWAFGIASAMKRTVIDDPAVINRVESALEWWFALGLALGFVALSWLIYQFGKCVAGVPEHRSRHI